MCDQLYKPRILTCIYYRGIGMVLCIYRRRVATLLVSKCVHVIIITPLPYCIGVLLSYVLIGLRRAAVQHYYTAGLLHCQLSITTL